MKRGFLSDYFTGIAMKRLSAVEANVEVSNQHEFNGVKTLQTIFGPAKQKLDARFIWFGEEGESLTSDGFLTWYDARENHPTRSEYRLYFPTTEALQTAKEGDAIFFARRPDGSVLVVVTDPQGTVFSQLVWLFGLSQQPQLGFELRDLEKDNPTEVDFAARFILEELGVEPEEPETDWLDSLLQKFGSIMPGTVEFSAFARQSMTDLSPVEAPDQTLLAWLEREEMLFRRLERHLVSERLEKGFVGKGGADIDGFISFSLSVQNRRKARAGLSLEHHLQAILEANTICFARSAQTENRSRPDFLFPGAAEYQNPSFPAARLTMLGAKSSCKDRWRQVLAEADRITTKHLLTIEPGISIAQTDEMRNKSLQLVLPRQLHGTYQPLQQAWLMDLSDFLQLVKGRQVSL